jgi:hypothetical protein
MRTSLTLLIVLALLCQVEAQEQTAVVLSAGIEHAWDTDGPFTVGFRFRVLQPISITSVGVFDHEENGLINPHVVGLWTVDGSDLMSVTIPAGTTVPLIDRFRYQSIAPRTLPAGGEYIIAGSNFGQTSDHYLAHLGVLPGSSCVELFGSREMYTPAGGLQFPTVNSGHSMPSLFGANFRFMPVPERSSSVLIGVAVATLLARIGRCSRRARGRTRLSSFGEADSDNGADFRYDEALVLGRAGNRLFFVPFCSLS